MPFYTIYAAFQGPTYFFQSTIYAVSCNRRNNKVPATKELQTTDKKGTEEKLTACNASLGKC